MRKYVLDTDKYSFSSEDKVITFYREIDPQEVLIITNITDGITIYNFGCEGTTGEFFRRELTLQYDTTSMSSTDDLLVIMQSDDSIEEISEAIKANTGNSEFLQCEMLKELKNITKQLKKINNPK